MSGVLLAVTGVEALFADLGHYNRQSIQWTLTLIIYPVLVVTYLGQAAALTVHPEWVSNAFYNSIPGGVGSIMYWMMFVLAGAASVVASQAMILGIFSVVRQAVQLDCFPAVTVVHTDPKVEGRVYIPVVNWLLLISVLVVCVAFGSGEEITNAYGFAVATVMLITTSLITAVVHFYWRLLWIWSLLFAFVFGGIEIAFWISTLKKIPQGAWFSCALGISLTVFMATWHWTNGKKA